VKTQCSGERVLSEVNAELRSGANQGYLDGFFHSPHPFLEPFRRQAVAQMASHVGTVTGPVSGSTRLASAPFGICAAPPRTAAR
jgi:hypothetical protein